ncbi:tRNA (5-methylaminomethyl-2-thiouridine)(34)-methyltransferase MnmD [Oscillatoria amoena NRMC-F 0135]|nr:tRNA (5-methylaminomethyl-2-thiouridine)(34)-methyltransferase MnmD [Oscillatoria amoena NRMC-F 0135]
MIEIILTQDGSHTLKNNNLNETYHSIHGAVQESLHVFIRQGFEFVLGKSPQNISILEVGFGTGLNAWLTVNHSLNATTPVNYVTLESFPLEEEIWSKLNYAVDDFGKEMFHKLHLTEWNQAVSLRPNFVFHKMHATLQDASLQAASFDLVYFDAFAPEKQPEMWKLPVLEKVASSMRQGAVWVTYCAKGQVKRDLKSLGLMVEALPGPPGKREMIRAQKT